MYVCINIHTYIIELLCRELTALCFPPCSEDSHSKRKGMCSENYLCGVRNQVISR